MSRASTFHRAFAPVLLPSDEGYAEEIPTYNLTADHVTALDVVTADGELRHVGEALSRTPEVPNAVGNRDETRYNVFLVAAGGPPDAA